MFHLNDLGIHDCQQIAERWDAALTDDVFDLIGRT
jgi:hypothetical protein